MGVISKLITPARPMPVRHVVMLKFKPEASEQAKLKVVSGINALTSSIPEIKSLKCGLDAGLAEGNHDFVATVDFDSPLDYNTYATVRLPQHPRWYAFVGQLSRTFLSPCSILLMWASSTSTSSLYCKRVVRCSSRWTLTDGCVIICFQCLDMSFEFLNTDAVHQ